MKSLLLLSLASAASASSSVHVPLVRRSPRSGVVTPESLAAQLDAIDSKYGRVGAKVLPRQSQVGVPMVNQEGDTSYYALMSVGTPPVPYGVALDTGSSDLWFQSESCTGCDGVKFSATSTSLQQTSNSFSIRYGSGSVGGIIASDTVEMGGFTVPNQVMGLVNQTSGVLLSGQSAGLLGLAFKFLANTESTPFWETLVSTGKWTEPLMSFWMTRYTNVTGYQAEEPGGEFRMGGTNSSLYTGEIEYHDMPAIVNSYWMIPLRQISVNGQQPMVITNLGVTSLAAIDTGTTLIGGPPDLVANIYQQIPGSQRGTGNLERYWIYPCTQDVTITFNFDGTAWPMTSDDFKLLTNDPQICVGAIFEASLGGLGNPDVPQWIVGDAFLKNVYSVFRYQPPSIGFARLSDAALGGTFQGSVPAQSSGSASSASVGATTQVVSTTPAPSRASTATVVTTSAIPTAANGATAGSLNNVGCLLAFLVGAVAWVL